MKMTTILTVAFLFTASNVFAQISVTANSLKSWLGFKQTIESDTSGTVAVNLGTAGENQTWDFSNLSGVSYEAVYEFFPSNDTPYASDYPEANYAFRIDFTSDEFSGMMYQYVDLQEEQMRTLANLMVLDTTNFIIDKEEDVTPLPITYGKTWATVSADTLEIPGVGGTITSIAETHTVDAWGTIKLPSGEYDCLRWKTEGTYVQSTEVAGYEIPIASYTYIDYTWIGPNSLLLATVSSMENETDANFTTASGVTWLNSISGSTDIAETPATKPENFALLGNFPNPFNPSTTITFQLEKASDVTVDIYDVRGQRIRRLAAGMLTAGSHNVAWDGTNARGEYVAGGTYFYKVTSDGHSLVRKMTLLK